MNKRAGSRIGAILVLLASMVFAACAAPAAPSPTPTSADVVAPAKAMAPTQAPPPPPTATPKPVELTVGLVAGTSPPLLVLKELGLDKKRGLDVKPVGYADFGILNIATGERQVDIGLIGPAPAIVLRNQGKDTIIIFPMQKPSNEVLVVADSPIKSYADLKGKKIGLFGGPAASTGLLFRVVTKLAAGFDPAKESVTQYGAGTLLVGLLEKGEIDAFVAQEPYETKLLGSGKFRSIGNAGTYTKLTGKEPPMSSGLTTTETVARQKPEAMTKFIAAFLEATEYLKTHDEAWISVASDQGITEPELVRLYRQRRKDLLMTLWDKKIIQDQIDGLKALIEINPDFAPGVPPEAFTDAYVPK